jgi:probable phosphoglycerate mutase
MMKKIYIVRHGETYINRYNKMQGWCDMPLTHKGKLQAQQVADTLRQVNFDLAVSSDLGRAKKTRDIIVRRNNSKDIKLIVTPFFREEFYGFFEGMDSEMAWRMIGGVHGYPTRKEIFKHVNLDVIKNWINEADPYHDAEDAHHFWKRINQGFEIIENAKNAKNILLVTHGHTIKSICGRFAKNLNLWPGPTNCSISTMVINSDNSKQIISYNQADL